MKRITATALAILLVLNLCVSAFALTLSPTVDKNSVAAGEDVTVTLSLDKAISDVTALEAKLYFDQDKFMFKSGAGTVNGVTVNETVQTEKDSGKPYIVVNYIEMSGKGSVPAGSYATVTFTASKAIKDVSNAAFSALIASSLMVDGSSSANTKEVSVSVKVTPASTEVEGYAVAASAENSSITVGETAQVALKISNSDETIKTYNAYYMEVSYDTNVLTYKGINTDAAVTDNNGTLKIAGYGDNKTCGTNDIVLTFIGKATGEARVTVISAKVDARANAAEKDAPAATITTDAATITVGGYQVTLPDGFTAASMVAEPNKDYTFTANDPSKKYDFSGSTMGGNPVTVTDNGNGIYTISNVTGELDIKATALVKIKLDNQAGAAIDGITDGAYVKPNTAINFTATSDAGKELVVTVNGEEITGVNRQGMYSYTIAADQVTGTELNIVVNYKSSTDTITIIGSGDAWSDVDHNSSVGWEESGKVTDKATAALKIRPATGKTIEDYVVTINGKTQDLTQEGRGSRTRYMVAFVPADVAKDNIIKIDVSYKKAPEPTITVDVSEYLNLSGKTMFLITASCTDLAEGKVLAYNGNAMYWSEKYNAYAWLEIAADSLETVKAAVTTDKFTVIDATDSNKISIAYNGDVNLTNAADINDAQLVWNMYNAEYKADTDFQTVNRLKYLSADMNGDKTLDTSDAAAIVNMIVGNGN